MIIDSHCHLDYEPLINNIDQVLLNAKNNDITNLLTIGTSLESSKKVLDIVNKYSNVYGAIGIHPNSASGNLDKLDELRVIEKKRKIYRKMNTDFSINHDLIRNKVLFLDTPKPEAPVKVKAIKYKESADSPDFLDDDKVIAPVKPKPSFVKTETVSSTSGKKKVILKKKIKEESDKEDDGQYKVSEKKVIPPKEVINTNDLDFID